MEQELRNINKKTNPIVRSELNLEQNSVFTVSTYREKSREIIVTEVTPKGEIHERKAVIGKTADGIETGVLTTHHFKLYLALTKFWEDAGKPINDTVHFTILNIIKCLGLTDSGNNYERMKKWLRNLRQIPLTFVDSFYVPEVAEHVNLTDITILNHLQIYERRNTGKSKKTRGYGKFQFDRYILQNLINNHSHPLRLDIIKSFKKHQDLAVLLYTYIDRNLAFRHSYEIRLEKLFRHLDLSQNYVKYPSHRKFKTEPVLEQLRGKELSTGILSYAKIHKTTDGEDYKLVCRKKPFTKPLKKQEGPSQPQPKLALPGKTELLDAESEHIGLDSILVAKGLTQKQAAKLILESPEAINDQLAYLPLRIDEYKAQGREINAAAILYDSISDNWQAPKSYREADKEKERKAKRLEAEDMARLEQQERDRAEQERAEIEAYKEALEPDEREELREKALEELRNTPGIREQLISDILIAVKENEILRLGMKEG